MRRTVLYILAAAVFLAGLGILLYPNVERLTAGYGNREKITAFQRENERGDESGPEDGEADSGYEDLLRQMQEYNTSIYEDGQKDLKDVWSYEQNPFDFHAAGLPDDMIGYITIDAMDEEMPLYIGANEENMENGAVVMGQTSMPIGGENTNCVIAAHRGYRGIPMFQYIEVLKPGDKVEITNLWDTLEYEVVKSIVIYPDDIDAVKIVPGEDMLTLITCHPYTKNYQRYVVYCRRTDGSGQDGESTEEAGGKADISEALADRKGVEYESSADDIRRERELNAAALAVLAVVIAAAAAALCVHAGRKAGKGRSARRRKRKKNRK